MSREELPKVGTKIIVHNPDGLSRSIHQVNHGDIGKVIGYLENDRILAFNPKWKNRARPLSEGYLGDFTYRGPCVVLMPYEFKVIK